MLYQPCMNERRTRPGSMDLSRGQYIGHPYSHHLDHRAVGSGLRDTFGCTVHFGTGGSFHIGRAADVHPVGYRPQWGSQDQGPDRKVEPHIQPRRPQYNRPDTGDHQSRGDIQYYPCHTRLIRYRPCPHSAFPVVEHSRVGGRHSRPYRLRFGDSPRLTKCRRPNIF